MPVASTWQRLERSLQRLVRLRELDAPLDVIEREIELAKKHWSRIPPAPEGARLVWPEGLEAVARELGFEPDSRRAPPIDPTMAEQIASASALYSLVARIAKEIEAAGDIDDLSVFSGVGCICLRGRARNDTARDRAAAIASRLAPDTPIQNDLVISSD